MMILVIDPYFIYLAFTLSRRESVVSHSHASDSDKEDQEYIPPVNQYNTRGKTLGLRTPKLNFTD